MFMFAILYVVFGLVLKAKGNIPYYASYLLLGIVLWNYFGEVTNGSVGAIVGRGDLLRKINFPKYVIILAGSASAIINLAFNFVVLGIVMYHQHVPLSWHALIIFPILAELFTFALALAFFLSALFVKFRDVTYIWEVLMQAGYFATPILYPLKGFVPDRFAKWILLNPMAQIIQDARHVFIWPGTPILSTYWNTWLIWLVPLGIVAVAVILGGAYFRKRSKYFAEEI